jgi:hypothetical protein
MIDVVISSDEDFLTIKTIQQLQGFSGNAYITQVINLVVGLNHRIPLFNQELIMFNIIGKRPHYLAIYLKFNNVFMTKM